MHKKTTAIGMVALLVVVTGVAVAITTTTFSDGDPTFENTSSQNDFTLQDGEFVLQTKASYTDAADSGNGEFLKGSLEGPGAVWSADANDNGEIVWVRDSGFGAPVDTDAEVNVELDIAELSGGSVELRDGPNRTIAEFNTEGTHKFSYTDPDGTTNLRIYGTNIGSSSSSYDSELRFDRMDFTHKYQARDGTLVVSNESDYLELSNIAEVGTLDVNGQDNPGSNTTFRVQRRSDGSTICRVENIEDSSVDLGQACTQWDPVNPDNSYLKFYFDTARQPDANGDTLANWSLSYEEQTDVPQVQSKYAILGGYETNADEGSSYVGSTDEFVVEDMDRDIQEVQWYVNGDRKKIEQVSGQGPFSFEREWSSGGVKYVRADVYSESTGTIKSVAWTVNVDAVAINGKDSFSVPRGQSFVLQQTFETNTDQPIDVEIRHDGQVVTKLSGPDETVVENGQTVSWEFLVEESNFDGEPVTVIAESDDRRVTKKIQVYRGTGRPSLREWRRSQPDLHHRRDCRCAPRRDPILLRNPAPRPWGPDVAGSNSWRWFLMRLVKAAPYAGAVAQRRWVPGYSRSRSRQRRTAI